MYKHDLHPSRRNRPRSLVRSVNQDFLQESRIPLAESVLKELKAVNHINLPKEEDRLGAFKKYLHYVKSTDGLPDRLRHAVLTELCRIVNTLLSNFFPCRMAGHGGAIQC